MKQPHPLASPSRRRGRRITTAVLALVLGVAVGRFVAFSPHSSTSEPTAPAKSPAEAVATLERAVDRNPRDTGALQALGTAYVRRAVQSADPSFYDLADRALARADDVAPDQQGTLLGRGALALSRHEFGQALTFGTRVHSANPDQPDALLVMVDAQVELGRYDEAAASLQELLDRRPALPAYARISYLRELHGDVPGALEAMRSARVAGAGSQYDVATVTALIGDLEYNRGRVVAANDRYRDALRLQPDLLQARLGRARVLAAEGHRGRAIHELQSLVARYPLPAAVALLGDLQQLDGRTADAARSRELVRTIAKLQQASGAVTDLEMAVFEADHAADPGDAAGAVPLARNAYAARPDNVYAADALAWALARSGDPASALPYAEQSLRLGTRDALLRYHGAVIFDALGDDARARAELTAAFDQNPWFSFLHRQEAAALAARLGVPAPAAWSTR